MRLDISSGCWRNAVSERRLVRGGIIIIIMRVRGFRVGGTCTRSELLSCSGT